MKINENYSNLKDSYLFVTMAQKTAEYKKANPKATVINMGIGDVTRPLPAVCVTALKNASAEMGTADGFHGYGPVEGYDFLRTVIAGYYRSFAADVNFDDVFVSDGAKNDVANILDIFSSDNTVLVPDPVYPVYVDTNIMAGRRVIYIDGNSENGFTPLPQQSIHADIIYLCSPNNPTGAVYKKEDLKKWIDYATEHKSLILFDAAYEAFIGDNDLPRSVFQIEGARNCCIELCSFSKTAGFTGTRCGYTVIPQELCFNGVSLAKLWRRRQSTKHNGVPYIIQRGAEAVLSPKGLEQCGESIAYYKNNTAILAKTLKQKGIFFTGGTNSPYVWFECPNGMKSWDFFDLMLTKYNIVGTPGSGFGKNGEHFFRLTGFGSAENTQKAAELLGEI